MALLRHCCPNDPAHALHTPLTCYSFAWGSLLVSSSTRFPTTERSARGEWFSLLQLFNPWPPRLHSVDSCKEGSRSNEKFGRWWSAWAGNGRTDVAQWPTGIPDDRLCSSGMNRDRGSSRCTIFLRLAARNIESGTIFSPLLGKAREGLKPFRKVYRLYGWILLMLISWIVARYSQRNAFNVNFLNQWSEDRIINPLRTTNQGKFSKLKKQIPMSILKLFFAIFRTAFTLKK